MNLLWKWFVKTKYIYVALYFLADLFTSPVVSHNEEAEH